MRNIRIVTSASALLLATIALSQPAGAQRASAQSTPDSVARGRWEFVMSSGALVPTGAQRDAVKDAQLSTAQLTYLVHPHFAVTATTGWARSRDLTTSSRHKLDIFSYDAGAEARASQLRSSHGVGFTPVAGIGIGGRSYNHRGLDVDASHNLAAYASVGGELGASRIRLRLEVRDYVTQFKALDRTMTAATARNDVMAVLGLRIVRRDS